MQPQIIVPEFGEHNRHYRRTIERLERSKAYKDLSTVWLTPTRGGRSLAPRTISAFMSLMKPMNQCVYGPLLLTAMEVGEAYQAGIQMILGNPILSKCQYVLTVEDDNLPPPDGLLKLYE